VQPGLRREIVNHLRAQQDRGGPLALAQTGREGEMSDDAGRALAELGWNWRPRDTSTHDPAHAGRPESPPPRDAGERHAQVSDSHEWERAAHEEADRSRFRRPGAPAQELPGMGAGGGEPPRVGAGERACHHVAP
jgi:hypothetical protein